MKDVIFINSHPTQYFAPMYKYMNGKGVKTKAWYCSEEASKGVLDVEFGVKVKWDVPLLQGYDYRFFKNQSWKPSLSKGLFGLINLGMVKQIFIEPKSVIIVHGWHYLTHFLLLLLGKIKGHTVCLRCELPQSQETLKKGWKQGIKRVVLKYVVFPRVNYFLYIGTQNRLFYKSYNLSEKRLLFCPYSVDNDRFRMENKQLKVYVAALRKKMGISSDAHVILYSGKFIKKKRPLDLLQAFHELRIDDAWLIMVGEGELRKDIECMIRERQIKNVMLTGFINQTQISEFYAISNVFVMCSAAGETWGLSVNEAMNFDLPIIVSDMTGCSDDLVKNGVNGYVFKTGNIQELSSKLEDVLVSKDLEWTTTSKTIVEKYSYASVVDKIRGLTS